MDRVTPIRFTHTHPCRLRVPGMDKLSEGYFPSPPYSGSGELGFPTPPYFVSEGFFPSPPYSGSGELGFPTPSYFCVRRVCRRGTARSKGPPRAEVPRVVPLFVSVRWGSPPQYARFSNPLLFWFRRAGFSNPPLILCPKDFFHPPLIPILGTLKRQG